MSSIIMSALFYHDNLSSSIFEFDQVFGTMKKGWWWTQQLCLVLQNQLFWLFLLPICLKRFDGKIINHWSGPQRENDSRVRESITEWASWTNTQTDFLIKWFIMNARGDQENLFINPLNCHKHRVTVAISIIYSIIFHSSDGQTMIQRQSHTSTILHFLFIELNTA